MPHLPLASMISTWVLLYHLALVAARTPLAGRLVSYTVLLHVMCTVVLLVYPACMPARWRAASLAVKLLVLWWVYRAFGRAIVYTRWTVAA